MQKLVIMWDIEASETKNVSLTSPVLYESPKKFLMDFEAAVVQSKKNNQSTFIFANLAWRTADFYFSGCDIPILPEVFTLDQWFEDFVAL